MKTGIVTFQRAHNYGALLQCFALQETLKGLGHSPEVIDHPNPRITRDYPDGSLRLQGSFTSRLKQLTRHLIMGSRRKRRHRVFDRFISSRLNMSVRENEKYDAVVYGSDQIWNDNITGGDPFYWGVGNPTEKKIGYAVSAGNFEKDIATHLNAIKSFDAIGAREASLSERLEALGIHAAVQVLDPTLLLDGKQWAEMLGLKKRSGRKPYLLAYPLRERQKTVEFAQELARKKGLDFIEVAPSISLLPRRGSLEAAGPEEFLELIMNADHVVTNSFHGTVFSIIFGRPFTTVNLQDGGDGRAGNLLKALGLTENHLTFEEIDAGERTDGEYPRQQTDARIEELRKYSLLFLKTNLKR